MFNTRLTTGKSTHRVERFPIFEVGIILTESGVFLIGLKLRPSHLPFLLFIFPIIVCKRQFYPSKERGHSGIGDTPFTNSVSSPPPEEVSELFSRWLLIQPLGLAGPHRMDEPFHLYFPKIVSVQAPIKHSHPDVEEELGNLRGSWTVLMPRSLHNP